LRRSVFAKIKGVYKRLKLKGKRIRTVNGERRALYNYAEIGAFEQLQYDTKEILDQHALPKEIYQKFKSRRLNLPKYQWTLVDAKTKNKIFGLVIYLNFNYGLKFLQTVILWLRAHNIQNTINARMDGGAEFFFPPRKENFRIGTNNIKLLGAHSRMELAGQNGRNNLVERTHRIDDEEFLLPRGEHINSVSDFSGGKANTVEFFTTTAAPSTVSAWKECRQKTSLTPLRIQCRTRFAAFRIDTG